MRDAGGPGRGQQQQQQQHQHAPALPVTTAELHHLMMTTLSPSDLREKLIPILLGLSQLRKEQNGPDLLALEGVELDTSDAALEALSLSYATVM